MNEESHGDLVGANVPEPASDYPTPGPTTPGNATEDSDIYEEGSKGSDDSEADSGEQTGRLTSGGKGLPQSKPALPDFTQGGTFYDIPEIRASYENYHQAYTVGTQSIESHLERAKVLAYSLLTYYYPANQGFTIRPESFEVATNGQGWSIEERPDAAPQKGRRNTQTDGRPPNPFPGYQRYHFIPAELIAGFAVYKTHTAASTSRAVPHTYLCIMIDDLKTRKWWQTDRGATNARGDIMAFYLGRAGIDEGYGMLLCGPRLEFWGYKHAAPRMEYLRFGIITGGRKPLDHAYDMRESTHWHVSAALEAVATEHAVKYIDGTTGYGPKHPVAEADDAH
jgi:hypothetical protein